MTDRDAEPPSGFRAPLRRRAAGRAAARESREQILRAATREFVTHGFAGARVNRIVAKAGTNPRMIYHYFGSKSASISPCSKKRSAACGIANCRSASTASTRAKGLLQLFDFLADYFDRNRHLVRLLSAENLAKAKFLRKSTRIPEMSSPVLAMIEQFIARGTKAGQLPPGLDGLRLYVLMVALTQFHLSNG